MQKATLDPSKISGRCGRLKCCLRYEFDTYEEMQGKMPSLGTFVSTPDGDGKVVGHEFLAEKVQVEMSDFQIVSYPIADIKVIHEAFDQRELRHTGEQADAAQLEQLDDKRETRGERRDKRKAPQKNIPQVQPRKSQPDDSKGSKGSKDSNDSNDSNDSFGAGILE